MNDSLVSRLDEIRERLSLLESNLPKRVDGWALSQLSKLPFKVLVYREALSWRMAELSRAAFEEFEKARLAAAIILTRAAFETSAALWYLCTKVEASVESAELGDIDDYLMKMSMGMATDPPTDPATGEPIMPRPVRIGTFLNCVEKDIEGFSRQYGYLSEYAHPNWTGTVYLYLKFDQGNAAADLGQNIRQPENTKLIFAVSLSNALLIFELSYNRITDIVPRFIKLCENRLDNAAGMGAL
ncbi:MAG: hypothetical protein WA876_15020 [Candidatus Acidiferrales bacterium]